MVRLPGLLTLLFIDINDATVESDDAKNSLIDRVYDEIVDLLMNEKTKYIK